MMFITETLKGCRFRGLTIPKIIIFGSDVVDQRKRSRFAAFLLCLAASRLSYLSLTILCIIIIFAEISL
jgi:hypothetical protein